MKMIEGQILHHKLLAEYWLAMATTGMATKRAVSKMTKSKKWKQISDEEKIDDALKCACRHIVVIGELVDKLPTE